MLRLTILYLIYGIIGVFSAITLKLLDARCNYRRSIFTVGLVLLMSVRIVPILLIIDNEHILIGSDQAYDYALSKIIMINGKIVRNEINARNIEYSYYPAIHLFLSIYMLISGFSGAYVCAIIPLVEVFALFIFYYVFLHRKISLAIFGALLASTTGYYALFHIQAVREVYAFALYFFICTTLYLSSLKRINSAGLPLILLIIAFSISHFFTRIAGTIVLVFTLMFRELFKKSYAYTSSTQRNPSYFYILLMLLSMIVWDQLHLFAYARSISLGTYFKEMLSFIHEQIAETKVYTQAQTIGSGLPEFDRYFIYINVLAAPMFLLWVFFYKNLGSRRQKMLLITILATYILSLLFRFTNDYYVVNIGLRSSEWIWLTFLLLSLYILRNSFIYNRGSRSTSNLLLVILLISVVTFPGLLPPTIKTHELTYYIPAKTAEMFSTSNYASSLYDEIYVLVRGPGTPDPDSFRGFDSSLIIPHKVHRVTITEILNKIKVSHPCIIYVDNTYSGIQFSLIIKHLNIIFYANKHVIITIL